MRIERVETPDGIKLRDKNTKLFLGSVGTGVIPPTTGKPKFSRDLTESAEDKSTYADIVSPKKCHKVRATIKAKKIIEEQVNSQKNNVTLSFGNLESQLKQFDSWASKDSKILDLSAPDINYRYDLLEPVLNLEHDDLDYDSARALRRLGYEHYYAQRLPVFIVGKKVTGLGFTWLDGALREIDSDCFLEGAEVSDANLPSAVEYACEGSNVEGSLVWIKTEDLGNKARESLDKIQEFDKDNPWDSRYTKTVCEVNNGKLTRPAWVYINKI